jgi:electron transport complex protein RnfE
LTPREPGQAYAEFIKGLWKENPVFVAVLGMCPSLAVTNTAINALAMSTATFFVLVGSCVLVSMVRRWIPREVRITAFLIIIATFVTVADLTLEALVPDVHRELGAFIALIVVNCIILGRVEAFAYRNPVSLAAADAAGMGFGFGVALFALGATREVLGNGSLFGASLFGPSFEPWVIMLLPPGGFLMLGLLLLIFAYAKEVRVRIAARERKAA